MCRGTHAIASRAPIRGTNLPPCAANGEEPPPCNQRLALPARPVHHNDGLSPCLCHATDRDATHRDEQTRPVHKAAVRETIDGEDEQVRRAEGGGYGDCEKLRARPVGEGEEESERDEEDAEARRESGDLR